MPVAVGSVRQATLNLLINACAATPSGGAVSLQAVAENGSLVIEVGDEGPGLPPALADYLTAKPSQPVSAVIAARIANHMERVFREMGKNDIADKFKGFDWKTEEDAFMDGYHGNAKGGEFVTYARLSAMGTNGVQEPATGFQDGKLIGTKRLLADGTFNSKDGKATFMTTLWRGLQEKKRSRKSSPSLSTTAAPTRSGRALTSTSRTISSWNAGRSPISRCTPTT